jgi:hypothetical protein
LQIGLVWGLIAVALGFSIWALIDWLASPGQGPFWGPGFLLFALASLVTLAGIAIALPGLRRYRAALSSGAAENYTAIVWPDGITVRADGRSTRFDWGDVAQVTSDKELLHSGLVRRETYSALLLIHGASGQKPTFALRRALRAGVLVRALFSPFELPGMSVIPTYFYSNPEARRLFAAAKQSHADFLAARPSGNETRGDE